MGRRRQKLKKAAAVLNSIFLIGISIMFGNFSKEDSLLEIVLRQAKHEIYLTMLKSTAPAVFYEKNEKNGVELFVDRIFSTIPVYGYVIDTKEYTTQLESDISYEDVIAQEALDENYIDENTGKMVGTNTQEIQIFYEESELEMKQQTKPTAQEKNAEPKDANISEGETIAEFTGESELEAESFPEVTSSPAVIVSEPQQVAEVNLASVFVPNQTPVVTFSKEKLNDFDYLLQNFYVVDRTTTINSSQLNAADLLSRSMKLTHTPDAPQILIYHTHSQEGFADSIAGDSSTTIVGVGAYLHKLLGTYGFHVLHHVGEYDVDSRDDAYSKAGPAIEQILKENPSIEVVIDLHRDGVAEGTRLVTEIQGKQTASIMFFNGLSKTTANGDISYLPNPYIQSNLAFSLQMQLAAEEYYPGFSRHIYLKGYRYNMHYCPKTLLVEVGAQTNTLQEAMNAMEPLADIIAKVIGE